MTSHPRAPRRLRHGALALATLLSAAACGGDGPTTPAPQPVRVQASVERITLGIDDTTRLDASVQDRTGRILRDAVVRWRSLDVQRVAVDPATGFVTAADTGTAGVVAYAGALEDTVMVRVTRRVASLRLSTVPESMFVAGSALLRAVALDARGDTIRDAALLWTTSDSTTLAVNSAGGATAANEGAATVRVAAGSVSATTTIRTVFLRMGFGGVVPTQLTLGSSHGCALDAEGRAYCWGSNSDGQLGHGTRGSPPSAIAEVTGGHQFTAIEARDRTTCALTTARRLLCWGRLSLPSRSVTPTGIIDSVPAVAFAVGMHAQACLIGEDGIGRCWGHNDFYQLGRGPRTDDYGTPRPVAGDQRFLAGVALGGAGGCAIGTGDATWCWGDHNRGTETSPQDRPVRVDGAPAFVQVESFFNGGSCGRTASGEVWCWGWNYSGQAGVAGSTQQLVAPTRIDGVPPLLRIDSGHDRACGITADGAVWCWAGASRTQFAAPRRFRTFAISASNGVCGITSANEALCHANVPGTGR